MTSGKCEEASPPLDPGTGNASRESGEATSPGMSVHNEAATCDDNGSISDQPAEGRPVRCSAGHNDIIKPANDDMSYRHLVLPNGLRVLLVSDPTTDKAGAAMDVRVGSLSDPDNLPGMAHFTEHMLFYSSEKYPEEDEYTKFVSERGGMTNAYTAAEHTNYHFDINWESLAPALDRFAQFFIAPTISRDGIEREVKAVDSEHGKNLLSDPWRKAEVNKATANPAHPYCRFSTGTHDTLYTAPLAAGIDPRDAVVDFYQRHYSADRCALGVLGRQSLDELEDMVRSMFSQVPNKCLPRPTFGDDVFRPSQLGVLIKMVPVREGQSLELVWQVPPSERLFRQQPLGYLSHLLGHEGEGSVFALLKAAGWASALWAGESGASTSFASFFTIHVDLTEEGQRNIQDVATVVFRYLALLRRPGGICERIWEEVRGLAQLQFDTRDRSQPVTYCTTLSSGLQMYPPQELLPAVYGVPREFSPSAIREALELMTPQRVRALWVSKLHGEGGGGDGGGAGAIAAAVPAAPAAEESAGQTGEGELLKEPVYGTRYGIYPLPTDWLAAWTAAQPEDSPGLHLPAPNRFIPTDLSLADDEAAEAGPEPAVALAVPGRIRIWHKPDTRFRQPKAVLYLDVRAPEAYTSPRAAVMTRLFTKLMLDYMNEVAYPAQQAGLDYNLINTQSGWQLLLSGYNHKMPELLSEVLDRLADFQVIPDRFEFVREGLVQEYANQLHKQPYSWAMYRAEMLTTARRWPIELYGSEAAAVTAAELQGFVARLHSRCFVEGLAAGNLRRREILRCGALLLGCLRDRCGAQPLHPAEDVGLRMLQIPPPPPPPPPPAVPPAEQAKPVGGEAGGGGGADAAAGPAVKDADGGGGAFQSVSGGWLYCEEVPNGRDENSAALVTYQVGPDDLRRNALRSLLVHMAKRDAFSELRTRQQLGYIVSLHGGVEHGVGYIEMLVQSNAYGAEELCHRLDDFMDWYLTSELPVKCGLVPRPARTTSTSAAGAGGAEAETSTEETAASGAAGATEQPPPEAEGEVEADPEAGPGPGVGGSGDSGAPSEFSVAVEELAKSKLEKPKKLADLASRWWSEVHRGCYCFDRQEAEVAQLRSLTPEELLAFARDLMVATPAAAATAAAADGAASGGCRKLLVQVRGKAEAAAATAEAAAAATEAAAGPQPGPATEANPPGGGCGGGGTGRKLRRLPYALIPADDPFEWKGGCAALPAVKSVWAARRAAAGEGPLPRSVAAEEVEELIRQARAPAPAEAQG